MAAHLAGAVAARTNLPVIGIPVASGPLNGFDALLATVQMPSGVPVATVAVNGAANAGVLAAQMMALGDPALATKLVEYKKKLAEKFAGFKFGMTKDEVLAVLQKQINERFEEKIRNARRQAAFGS